MRPATVHVLALLLVVSAVAVPASSTAFTPMPSESVTSDYDGPSPIIAPVDGFANYASLSADEVALTSYTSTTVDVGTAIAADTSSLRGQYHSRSFENRFYQAEGTEERNEIISEYTSRAERHTDRLKARRNAAIRDYASGTISAESFLRSMALVHSESERLATTIDRIKRAARTSSYSLPRETDTKLENLRGDLEVLRGPISQRASRAVAGDGTIDTIYVEASDSGYTIAMVDGESYLRETYLGDERRPNATDQFRESDLYLVNAANRRGVELYPWITNDTSPSGQALGESGIYRFRAEYTSGELTAYLDGGTTNVFRETQRQSVTAVPVTDSISSHNGSLRVLVNRTYDTGPMNVTLVDNSTGEPIDGTVSADGTQLGRTGQDGTIWLVEPRPATTLTLAGGDGETVQIRLTA